MLYKDKNVGVETVTEPEWKIHEREEGEFSFHRAVKLSKSFNH